MQFGVAVSLVRSGGSLQQRGEVLVKHTRVRPGSRIPKTILAAALAAAVGLTALVGPRGLARANTAAVQAAESAAALRARQLAEQTRPQHQVPFNPTDFDKFVGYYELAPMAFFHVFRHGDQYFAQLTGQAPVREYPESATKFFATVVAAQISFVTDARGRVTGLVLHQNGYLRAARRVSRQTAARAEAQLQRRIQHNVPAPGTAAAVRAQILSFEHTGHALYARMTPGLAAAARAQAGNAGPLFRSLGALQSLHHYKVLGNGADDYLATFAHGRLEVIIAPLTTGGKVQGLFFHPVP